MSTTITNPKPPKSNLPTTYYLRIPKFSISPLHAQALSNIYARIAPDLFIPRDPHWKTSPLSPKECKEYGKRHYRRTHSPGYQGPREVNMGKHYTTDPRGLLPGAKLQRSAVEELTTYQDPDGPWPHRLAKKTQQYDDTGLSPRFGDLVIDGQGKRARAGIAAASSLSSSSSSSSSPSSQPHARRKPILGAGLVQEISIDYYNSKMTKDEFPVPFCLLPDYKFVAWFVRSMGMLGVRGWEAEGEAMGILWRTEEKGKKKRDEEKMLEKKRAGGVENENEDEDEDRDTCEIVREMRLRLYAIERKKAEKREKRNKILWIWTRVKRHHKEVTSVEDLDLQTRKHAIKRSQIAWIKGCFLGK